MMNQTMMERLLALPELIATEEMKLLDLEEEMHETKELILDIESDLRLSNECDGKNEQIRMALLRKHVNREAKDLKKSLQKQQMEVKLQKIHIQRLRNEFLAIQTVMN